ncbi:MAG: hypothetical protein ACJ8IR_02650 [Alphaproteobacteria bacterium]|jgi:hypothetical protein
MDGIGSALKSLLMIMLAIFIGGYVARHAFSEGIHTIIAAEPATPKFESAPVTTLGSCQLDSHLQYSNPLRCRMEMRNAPAFAAHVAPLETMTKAQSETASGWLMLAMFAVPLSLGLAGLLGFLLFRAALTE